MSNGLPFVMGSDKARKRRARQLEAQFEKKRMRRAHFSLGGGVGNQSERVENIGHSKDDGMTNALRKMLAMKEGRKQNHRNAGNTQKKSQRKHGDVSKALAQQDKAIGTVNPNKGPIDDGEGRKKARHQEKEEEKKVSASKLKRKAFMKKKGKKTRDGDLYEPDPGTASAPMFGEQADRPIEATLKRRHWVDSETPKPLTLSMKNVGSRMDSKALAALYRTSRRNRVTEHRKQATMDTLKQLVKSTTMESQH